MKGPVKSVLIEAAAYSGSAGNCSEGKRTIESRSRYNTDGNLVESTDYNPDGSVFKKEVFTYTASGARQAKAIYDTAGFLVEKLTFDTGNAGRLVSSDMYKHDGSVNSTTTWQYNLQGQRVGLEAHDSSGNLVRSATFNPAGQATEEDDYKDGVLSFKRVFVYNANGNLLELRQYDLSGSPTDGPKDPTRLVNSYDSTGRLVERAQYNADGSLRWRQTSAFDKNRNIADQSMYDQAGVLKSHRTYAYEYDSAGNWTTLKENEEVSNTCSRPIRVLYRTITYY